MSLEQVSKSSVLIAGAGIGGLAMALSLLRRGIDCDVFEQASELREVGAGLWISMNGVRVLRDLGLTEQVEQNCIAAERRSIRLWNTGDRWPLYNRSSDAARNQPYLLLRAHLLKILVDGVRELKPGAIHLSAHVVGFSQDDEGVRAKLADGSEVEGRALMALTVRIRRSVLASSATSRASTRRPSPGVVSCRSTALRRISANPRWQPGSDPPLMSRPIRSVGRTPS